MLMVFKIQKPKRDRSHFVYINGSKSWYETIKYGLRQSSVLDSLLLLIFINCLSMARKNSDIFHFADNTCLLNIKDLVKQINKVVNKDLKFLEQWLNANRVSLNVAKTCRFRRTKKQLNCDLNLKLCDKKLKPSNFVRYLGII